MVPQCAAGDIVRRMFPLIPELREILAAQKERTHQLELATGRVIPWVFHRDGAPILDYYGAWDKACRLAGLADRLVHDLRRTAVRSLERAGVSRSAGMKMTNAFGAELAGDLGDPPSQR